MKYDVNVIVACEDSVWDSDTAAFPAKVKTLIDGLTLDDANKVDYKFKITSAGAQRSSWDSEDLLTVSRHFVSAVKASFTIDSLSKVQSFENSLASECSKLDTNYKLKVRTKNHIG